MLHDHLAATPRHPNYRVGLSCHSEISPQDVAFHMITIAQDETEGRRRARKRAWAAITDWVRTTGRDPFGPTTAMAARPAA